MIIWLAVSAVTERPVVLQERSVLLKKWFELLMLHKDDLAKLITFECVSTMPSKGTVQAIHK